ncbi:MAG: hypothetical protein HY678_02545 [Chloroflexi bacterium]|nr:hypothetical protein [Chloroflexota bacterium]
MPYEQIGDRFVLRRRFGKHQARVHTQAALNAMKHLDSLLAEAETGRVWKALGYESREAWLKAEVPTVMPAGIISEREG